ncbi:MAG TPA: phosphomannomutase/phosphoglucomutase [Gemmatimonadaceae bacterium]|nr:phosphomannomutase/phosphoglucomutase [Gemmatimonadaceae bacterium]
MDISQGIFRQYDIRGIVGKDLTVEVAALVGRAFGTHLRALGARGAIAVGRDNRPSGGMLRDAMVSGITSTGFDVIDIGVVPTPLLYWALHKLPVAGGIQITGSHNPAEYNGFKLSAGTASLHGDAVQRLYEIIESRNFATGEGVVQYEDVIERYLADMVERVGVLSRPVRVVLDCGNGAGAVVGPQLLRRLGANLTTLFCESDGTFPNHHPDPTVVENLSDIIAAVREQRADIGIAFDGDADRIGVVDERGEIVWGDHVLILYARDVLARTGHGQAVIFDVKCSQALPDAIAAAGGKPVMWKTGHSLIKDKMKAEQAPVAGEMSGHMFFEEGFYGHDDAMYAAGRLLRILADSGDTVSGLLADVPPFVSTPEIRIHVEDARKFGIVEDAVRHFRAAHDVIDVDGVRVLYGDGWGLIRASNTQPVLVMRFEARSAERIQAIRGEFEQWLRAQGVVV